MRMAPLLRPSTAEGIYGCLAVAVVCTAWTGSYLPELAAEIIIYSLTLWAFHIYARVAHGGWSSRSGETVRYWAKAEWPHLEAAVPALVLGFMPLDEFVIGLDPASTADLALAATVANLLLWQVALLIPERPSVRALVITVLLDVAVVAALISLRLWIK